jgi:glycosyltransferase involved in cell wall biosynthesis
MITPVGFLTYALDRNPRGIGQYTLHLLVGLKANGVAPLVLQSGSWPVGFPGGSYQTVTLSGARLLPALLTLGQVQIGWQVQRLGLQMVHDPTGTGPLGLCLAKRVTTIHDVIPFVNPKACTTLDRLIYRFWLPVIVQRMDAVITVSSFSKLDLSKYLNIPGRNIFVTYQATDSKFRLLAEAEIAPVLGRNGVARPYILYVGSLEPRKNLLRLLDAYQQVLKWSRHWRLIIVGARNYWKSSPVAEKVKQLGLQGQVIFTGYISDEDLPSLYNAADLFVFPSLYEGFGLPVLEAMACGTPVVTSNSSSLPEVAGDAAILVDPYSVEAIYAAMRRVLEDPELAKELRRRGLERALQFTWEKTARETIAVYEKVLGEKYL